MFLFKFQTIFLLDKQTKYFCCSYDVKIVALFLSKIYVISTLMSKELGRLDWCYRLFTARFEVTAKHFRPGSEMQPVIL